MRIDPGRLRQLREQCAWSQEQLAEVAGLSVRTVQRIESGSAASPESRMVLAAALEVAPAGLSVPVAPQADAAGAQHRRGGQGDDERAFRSVVITLGLAIVFVLLLLFGYLFGRDIAFKDNRHDCIAQGRTDCR